MNRSNSSSVMERDEQDEEDADELSVNQQAQVKQQDQRSQSKNGATSQRQSQLENLSTGDNDRVSFTLNGRHESLMIAREVQVNLDELPLEESDAFSI